MGFLIGALAFVGLAILVWALVRYAVGPDKGNKTTLDIRISLAAVFIFGGTFVAVIFGG